MNYPKRNLILKKKQSRLEMRIRILDAELTKSQSVNDTRVATVRI